MTRSAQLSTGTLLALGMATSCLTPPAGPVPVQGAPEEVRALSGHWSGRYWSKDTGRRGTIRFSLAEQADTGYGEVEITFSPSLSLAEAAAKADALNPTPADEPAPTPCTVIDITLVRVESRRIRGTMAPYWDPDCNCRARTVFEGELSGNRVTGTFSSHRESNDRRILTGQWQVDREPS
jgi:hypothetical protein